MKRRGADAGDGDGVTRRDFVNGTLAATGGLAFGSFAPEAALAKAGDKPGSNPPDCGDILAADPRVARGGNRPSVFNIGHWMRDNRLTFTKNDVTLAAGCDNHEGKFPIVEDGEEVDVIIAGGGLGGLSTAFYLLRRRPDLKIRILESNSVVGGNASYDDSAPLPVRASTCGAYTAMPDADYLKELFHETGLDTDKYPIESPVDSYFFDEHTPGLKPGRGGWRIEMLSGLKRGDRNFASAPYDDKVMSDIARCVETFAAFHDQPGAPDEPPDLSSPRFDDLASMSFATYLTDVLHCDPRVADFYTAYTIDCMGGAAHQVNAHTVISFLSSDYSGKFFAYPGGTAQVAIQLQQWLAKPATKERAAARIDTNAMVLKVEADLQSSRAKVGAIYYKDGQFRRARAKNLVVATQVQAAKHIIEHLLEGERKAAWAEFNTAPALCVNLALRNMAPLLDLGLGYSNYWWGGKYWSNFLVADWTTEKRLDPKRASVLTFYSHVSVPKEEFPQERMKLLTTPFQDFERSLEADLTRIFKGTTFDFKKDVSAIFLYRWGHSMILAAPKLVFGDTRDEKGRLIRSKAPRRVACRPMGPISFAGQYAEGTPSVESAIGSGHRAALEVIARL